MTDDDTHEVMATFVESYRLRFSRLTGTLVKENYDRYMNPVEETYPVVWEDEDWYTPLSPFRIFYIVSNNQDASRRVIEDLKSRMREESLLGRLANSTGRP